MTSSSLTDRATGVAVSGRRAEVLAALRTAGRPLTAADLAAVTGLHLNTARFHLDALVAERLADRSAEEREVPGRPRILYTTRGALPGPRSYGLLAEMLTGLVTSLTGDAGPAATEAGRAWGRHLVERAAPSERVTAAEAIARLGRVLDAVGFSPEVRPRRGRDVDVRLHHCPFREVAERHTDVVCEIHLGLMQGALAELQAPVSATSLQPFVAPDLCVARLRTAERTPREEQP
jgi:predicted ArsR family transcriptional regulator